MQQGPPNELRRCQAIRRLAFFARQTTPFEDKKEENEFDKEYKRLAKTKSVLLKKLEDGFEATLHLIDGPYKLDAMNEAKGIISPVFLKKTITQEEAEEKEKKLDDVLELQSKIFDESQQITQRIFTIKRLRTLMNSIFRGTNREDLDKQEREYRVSAADTLLQAALNELEYYLPIEYREVLLQHFDMAKGLANIIETKHGGFYPYAELPSP